MDTAIVVFTRDLRLHDNPALHQAYVRARMVTETSHRAVVPVKVLLTEDSVSTSNPSS